MRRKVSQVKSRITRSSAACLLAAFLCLGTASSCDRAEPLTAAKAADIIRRNAFRAEPVYAEVPQRVWWTLSAPRDDFDDKSLRTFEHLKAAGLITVSETHSPDGNAATYLAKVTPKGFPILGTAPSFRGAVYRARICEKKIDGLRNFVRHPSEPTTGHAELIWHYENPTSFYDMFETKRNKPLKKPFASYISFYFKDHQWRFDVTVRKVEVE